MAQLAQDRLAQDRYVIYRGWGRVIKVLDFMKPKDETKRRSLDLNQRLLNLLGNGTRLFNLFH